eukprot:gnl/Chilomastix_caulleri/807.p1 GENE.gnl/Chilomastix_caulleri/807~~gnl/Chilomastix_caulleri/807.p1  ORF type:complete len:265 (+),score=101.02 gnl/Chilomastix_caulleri/807:52-846(+)
MVFVRVIKGRAYFKRFQVQFRRRREGKTDYNLRKQLVSQDKTKFNIPKYRFVVRISRKNVICQIISAKLDHDEVLCCAQSNELPRYGIPVGLKNYAACYCTGLLLARRLLNKLGIDSIFSGVEKVTGEFLDIEEAEMERRPFRCNLDIGLKRSTTGARVFAAMKGAVDGGIYIPHNPKRFFGYNKETKSLDAAALRKRILGGHVADYMNELKEDNEDNYKTRFSAFLRHGITPEKVEAMYLNAHIKIRENPNVKKPETRKERSS